MDLDSLDEIVSCAFNYSDDPLKDVAKIILFHYNESKQERRDQVKKRRANQRATFPAIKRG
jgi:hypothetical protein